ncbi:MAG: type II toxin-antitoxin system RatA family toxin [Candidatus Nitrosocosmicus sp.]
MTIIETSKVINSSIEKLWNIISDVDRDPEYWHGTKSIKNIKKEGNTIERETTISFKNSRCKEIVTLDENNKNKIKIEIIEGPIHGEKIITLEKIGIDSTKIAVTWNINLKGAMAGLFTIFIKKHILKGTKEALERISSKSIE